MPRSRRPRRSLRSGCSSGRHKGPERAARRATVVSSCAEASNMWSEEWNARSLTTERRPQGTAREIDSGVHPGGARALIGRRERRTALRQVGARVRGGVRFAIDALVQLRPAGALGALFDGHEAGRTRAADVLVAVLGTRRVAATASLYAGQVRVALAAAAVTRLEPGAVTGVVLRLARRCFAVRNACGVGRTRRPGVHGDGGGRASRDVVAGASVGRGAAGRAAAAASERRQ